MEIITKVIICIALFALLSGLCVGMDACAGTLTNPEKATRLLEEMGYTNIKIVNRDVWFVSFKGGDGRDNAIYTIEATNPNGSNVIVQVYEGWPFKSATLRGR